MSKRTQPILAGIAVALTLAAWSAGTHAQPAEPASARPAPVEVAAGMAICLAGGSTASVLATGGVAGADIEEDGEVTLLLERREGDPRLRAAGAEVWLEDDPLQPPLVLIFKQSRYDYPLEARQRAATCFSREYRRLLRLWIGGDEREPAGAPRPMGERDSATTP